MLTSAISGSRRSIQLGSLLILLLLHRQKPTLQRSVHSQTINILLIFYHIIYLSFLGAVAQSLPFRSSCTTFGGPQLLQGQPPKMPLDNKGQETTPYRISGPGSKCQTIRYNGQLGNGVFSIGGYWGHNRCLARVIIAYRMLNKV